MVADLNLIKVHRGFIDLVGLGLPVIECQCDLAFFKDLLCLRQPSR